MRSWLARWSLSLVLLLGIVVPVAVLGQDAEEPAPAAAAAPSETAAAAPSVRPDPPRVTAVRSNDPDHLDRAALGDAVILTVTGLESYLDGDQDACGNLILFLAEVPIPGSPPEACDPYTGQVRFQLDRTADSDQAWHVLLAEPVSFTKKVSVSLGSKGRLAFPTEVEIELEIVPALELVSFLIALVLTILVAAYLAKTTAILRYPVPGLPPNQAPYSLARFQLAFWTLLVIAAYLFIWLITEELDTITGSVLALLGIGSATALGATIIDQGKPASPAPAAPAVEVPPGTAVPPPAPAASRGFLNDVLSDDQGLSIYRFQLFAWTLVLGVIFCASVYNGLAMPQFSTTLLGLMGVSSGTYLGFKVPEKSANP